MVGIAKKIVSDIQEQNFEAQDYKCVIRLITDLVDDSASSDVYQALVKHKESVLMRSKEHILWLNEYRKLSPHLSEKILHHKNKHQICNKVYQELLSIANLISNQHPSKASYYYIKTIENLKEDLA